MIIIYTLTIESNKLSLFQWISSEARARNGLEHRLDCGVSPKNVFKIVDL